MTQVADRSTVGVRLRVTGADRVTFLHGQCTNDINALRAGAHCYTAFLTAKGKMRGDADIVCLDDAFLVSTSPGMKESLEKFVITEDVVIEDVSGPVGEWAVFGGRPAGQAVFENRMGGWNVLGDRPAGEAMSREEYEVRRVEAGVPCWGVDMDENTIPVEAGLAAWAISYTKGCYIGQETIARIKTYGHVNRQLLQLKVDSAEVPKRGEKIFHSGHEAGQVTSAVFSARAGKVLALGYLRRELAKLGAIVTVGGVQAEVIKVCGN